MSILHFFLLLLLSFSPVFSRLVWDFEPQDQRYDTNIPGKDYDVPHPSSRRGAMTFHFLNEDIDECLYLYGGYGNKIYNINEFFPQSDTNAGFLNDLWCYNGETWSKRSGSNSINPYGSAQMYGAMAVIPDVPGGRDNSHYWVRGDYLIFFGGLGKFTKAIPVCQEQPQNCEYLKDLWAYNHITNIFSPLWTPQYGFRGYGYGTANRDVNILQDADPYAIYPSARVAGVTWTAKTSGNLYLFGGLGFDVETQFGFLSDLWVLGNDMLWHAFSCSQQLYNTPGVYGTFKEYGDDNYPGARAYALSWISGDENNLFLFGGVGYDSSAGNLLLNDLWQYDILRDQWMWTAGCNRITEPTDYLGTRYHLGARYMATKWNSGDFVGLFGGLGYLENCCDSMSYSNDMYTSETETFLPIYQGGERGLYSMPMVKPPGYYETEHKYPGGRGNSMTWFISDTKLAMYGGLGFGRYNITVGYLSDLWFASLINVPDPPAGTSGDPDDGDGRSDVLDELAVNGWDFNDVETYFFSIGLLVFLLLALFALLYFLGRRHGKQKPIAAVIVLIAFSNLIVNGMFLYSLYLMNLMDNFYIGVAAIGSAMLFNQVAMCALFIQTVKTHQPFSDWYQIHNIFYACVLLLSSVTLTFLRLLSSRIFGLSQFKAPLPQNTIRISELLMMVTYCIQDIPLLAIQGLTGVTMEMDKWPFILWLALSVTAISFLVGLWNFIYAYSFGSLDKYKSDKEDMMTSQSNSGISSPMPISMNMISYNTNDVNSNSMSQPKAKTSFITPSNIPRELPLSPSSMHIPPPNLRPSLNPKPPNDYRPSKFSNAPRPPMGLSRLSSTPPNTRFSNSSISQAPRPPMSFQRSSASQRNLRNTNISDVSLQFPNKRPPPPPPSSRAYSLPTNWCEMKSDDDEVYFYNTETGESQWEIPQ